MRPPTTSRMPIRMASTSSASTSSTQRKYLLTSAAVATTFLAGWALTPSGLFADDRFDESTTDDRPSPLWALPSRSQMLQALRESSAKSIRPSAADKQQHDESLVNATANQTKSSAPSPVLAGNLTEQELAKLDDAEGFDLLVVGGGATGTGVAVDAATRGLSVALVERDDFGSGTSSKSTKLIHGGVRYLQKAVFELDYGQYKMVKEALHERKTCVAQRTRCRLEVADAFPPPSTLPQLLAHRSLPLGAPPHHAPRLSLLAVSTLAHPFFSTI